MKRVLRLLSAIGPGLFAIGYTIGTGSVTSMAKAGSDYGLGLLWVLALSCLFSGVLMEAYGRMAAVTGETSLHAIKRFLPGGKGLAAALFTCIVLGQYTCLGGILVLSSGALAEVFRANVPLVAIAIPVMGVMYALLMIGHISVFEKILSFFVALMALTFVFEAFVTCPGAATLARAAKPILPSGGASLLMLAAFVGTTMAAPTFVTRPLLVKAKGWSAADLAVQRRDSIVSAVLMFVISGAIMFVSTGVLFKDGRSIVRILDIAGALEPVAGRFAVAFFMVGVLAAGLSSIFPILMVAPILIGDWRHGELETKTGLFRVICFVAAVYGVLFTLIKVNPVMLTVAAQVSNVFALPLAVGLILWLTNRRDVMGAHRAGAAMNLALVAALVFSVAVAAAGVSALRSGVPSAKAEAAEELPPIITNCEIRVNAALKGTKKAFYYCDDVIWLFRDLTRQRPKSLFDNPFLKVMKEAHDRYGMKVQLNCFYRLDFFYGTDEFTLKEMTDAYKAEWQANKDWLRLGFHSLQEFPDYPFINADYKDMKRVLDLIGGEIRRFAGEGVFAKGAVVHWGTCSKDACRALKDAGFGVMLASCGPRTAYNGDPSVLPYGHAMRLEQNRKPETCLYRRISENEAIASSIGGYNNLTYEQAKATYGLFDYVYDRETGIGMKELEDFQPLAAGINLYTLKTLEPEVEKYADNEFFVYGNHEQYFYRDYLAYQPEYAAKVLAVARILKAHGYEYFFFEDLVAKDGIR